MNVIVFEDEVTDRLGDLVAARPACDLTIGSLTLVEALSRFGNVHRVIRPHLARHLAAVRGLRLALWGQAAEPDAWDAAASRHGSLLLLVNARVIPGRAAWATLRSLVESGRRCVVPTDGGVAAALVHLSPDGRGPDTDLVAQLVTHGPAAAAAITALALPHHAGELSLVSQPHDIVSAHEECLEESLAARLDAGGFVEVRPGLHVAAGATVAEAVAVRRGPVVVAAGAEIAPFVCLDGPIWIGPEARVNPHSWLRAGTCIGRACRVGGEIEQSVLEPFSNKPHDGFLGHSHVGSWVNLAAGTITSNLKTTYGSVRQRNPGGVLDTGLQFLGALVGDCAKTAIHTALPCGARIGVAATVGGAVPPTVPAFHTLLVGGAGGSRTSVEQACVSLGRMMARRGLACLDADRDLLAAIAEAPSGAAGTR